MKTIIGLGILFLMPFAQAMNDNSSPEMTVADDNTDDITLDDISSDDVAMTALCNAVKALDEKKVKKLLKKGVNPDSVDSEKKSALTLALETVKEGALDSIIIRKRNRILELLCFAGADPKKRDSTGSAPLDKARVESVRKILANEKNIDERLLLTISEPDGSEKYSPGRIKDLLDLGANPNVCDDDAVTALMWATIHGRTQVVNTLLNVPAIDTKKRIRRA